jgi:hypothetical protein
VCHAAAPLLAALAMNPGPAPEPAPRRHALVADLGLHVVGVGYQRRVNCYLATQVSVSYYAPWTMNLNVLGLAGDGRSGQADTAGVVVRARAFLFGAGEAPTGFWLSPFVQTGAVWATRGGAQVFGPTVAVGLSAGWTFALGDRVLLGLGLGGQYHAAWFEGDVQEPGFERFSPTVDINLGVRL